MGLGVCGAASCLNLLKKKAVVVKGLEDLDEVKELVSVTDERLRPWKGKGFE